MTISKHDAALHSVNLNNWKSYLETDSVGLQLQSEQGARNGYTGKQIIHPNQIPIVCKAFTPSAERVEWATQLIAAFEKHQESGEVSCHYQGFWRGKQAPPKKVIFILNSECIWEISSAYIFAFVYYVSYWSMLVNWYFPLCFHEMVMLEMFLMFVCLFICASMLNIYIFMCLCFRVHLHFKAIW